MLTKGDTAFVDEWERNTPNQHPGRNVTVVMEFEALIKGLSEEGIRPQPELSHNEWAIFRVNCTSKEAISKIVILHHPAIADENFRQKQLTIRRFGFEKIKPSGSLFEKLTVILTANSECYAPIHLQDITSDAGIEIAGVMISTV